MGENASQNEVDAVLGLLIRLDVVDVTLFVLHQQILEIVVHKNSIKDQSDNSANDKDGVPVYHRVNLACLHQLS